MSLLRIKELEAQLARRDERIDELEKDAERLDFIEEKAKGSRTGVSFDWCKHVEDGYVTDHGYRMMRVHELGNRFKTLRESIDAAMNK
jgi:hypothetical protein